VQVVFRLVTGAMLLGMTIWGALAIYYADLTSATFRTVLSVAFVLGTLGGLLFIRPRRRAILGFLLVFVGIVAWWLTIPPSHDRDWQPDVAVLPYATFAGDAVTIHNIRNNEYRSETDFTPQYYDKTFHLSKLRNIDLFLSYWGPTLIAHTIMSFGFDGEEYVAISREKRGVFHHCGVLQTV
jgi:hypothetical protein